MATHGVDISNTDRVRFWLNVEPGRTDDECWEWTAAIVKKTGYGRFGLRYEVEGAHRIAYLLEVGPIPPRAEVHHRCENKRCVNPSHLEALTAKEHRAHHELYGAAAFHAAKETCAEGHPFDGHNGKQRTCSVCHRRAGNEWARRNKDAKNEYRRRKRAEGASW